MRTLGSTYRIQLNGLGFCGATRAVPYFAGLGVQTLYVSPIGRARSGSTHGYDVTDPTMLDPQLGTATELEGLLQALEASSMRLLVDIVPNHMAASVENPFFADVLRRGHESEYAHYFDIAWDDADGRIVLPVLGAPLAALIEDAEIRISRTSGVPEVVYGDLRLPVAGNVSGDDVRATLGEQHYELVDWRVAGERINYRRFFDISDLIAVRQEDPEVFRATHTLVEQLSRDERVAGFRVDHVDGLRDPAGYLARLRALTGGAGGVQILVEKVLARAEQLPNWEVEGTTGYEFAADLFGLFVDPAGAARQASSIRAASGDARGFHARAVAAKERALRQLFPKQLAHVEGGLGASGVVELTAHLAVYRTYRRRDEALRPEDDRWIAGAVRDAALTSVGELTRLAQMLTADLGDRPDLLALIEDWQQLTGAVAAKGVEDTATFDPGTGLVAADVGSDPDHSWAGLEEFHRRAAGSGSGGLATTSTHDSKRSEDVRCRLAVLSEVAPQWEMLLRELVSLSRSWRLSSSVAVDPAELAYLLETLVGAWPIGALGEDFVDRIEAHVTKAAREAKRRSSWLAPDELHEAALRDLVRSIVTGRLPPARRSLERLVADIEYAGVTNSLSSVVIKAGTPWVPDVYQGSERWALDLVDPDNRRAVDFGGLRQQLDGLPDPLEPAAVARLLGDWRDGRIKQHILRAMLRLRRANEELLATGDYLPMVAGGARADHVIAFARIRGNAAIVVVAPRRVQQLAGPGRFPLGAKSWHDTYVELPSDAPLEWRDALSGSPATVSAGRLSVADLTATLPVAVLVAVSD